MTVDFDLVVIGDSWEGIEAATRAIQLKARVALVASPTRPLNGSAESLYSRILARWATLGEPWQPRGLEFARAVADGARAEHSLETLAALGVDVLVGTGEFCRLPQLAVLVGHRRLRSRAYLLATGSQPEIPAIDGLSEVGYFPSPYLWEPEKCAALPERLAILGGNPLALELAQSLQRLGKEVTLIVAGDRLLPAEDAELSRWLQARLEADGVRLVTRASVSQIRKIEGKKWLQAGNTAIETEEILLATQPTPRVAGLNLAGIGVTVAPWGVHVNEQLQTRNPRIYACGSVLGGYPLANLARYEAQIAVKNALFLPKWGVNYHCLPIAIFTEPNLARVGMSEAQARQEYGEDAIALRQSYKSLPQARIWEATGGFCKFVLHADGEILGAHLFGAQAVESIAPVALALQNRLKIDALAKFPAISPSFSEIVTQIARQWQAARDRRPGWRNTLRRVWFDWARR